MKPLVEVRKVERGHEVYFSVAIARGHGTTMHGLHRDLPAAVSAAKRLADAYHANVRIEGAKFTVGIERLDATTGEPCTVEDATSALATARIHYAPVLRTHDGTVVLRLMGSSDLPTALEEARAFADEHGLAFDDHVLP